MKGGEGRRNHGHQVVMSLQIPTGGGIGNDRGCYFGGGNT